MKTASTRDIIECLERYEKMYGRGSVTSIGSVCSGSREVEYVFRIKNKHGNEVQIEIPSVEEKQLW